MNKILVMIVANSSTNTWHPIFYLEAPLPGGEEVNKTLIRYKSKMHHTAGFDSRIKALDDLNTNLIPKVKEMFGTDITMELDTDLLWDGVGVPTDIQFRTR